jgi:hypothetical protein
VVSASVLSQLNDGAVLVNYDRGELVDIAALDAAMSSGKVRYAAIDADIFKDAKTGQLSGPMVPYLALARKYPGRLELLPHAAADTEHVSRVEGARQAVDQIFDCIQYKRVSNLKGELPDGYVDTGPSTVPCVGKVTADDFSRAVSNDACLAAARQSAEKMAAIWGALAATADPARQKELMERHGPDLVKFSNIYATLMMKLGLQGPFAS